jgi:flagellin
MVINTNLPAQTSARLLSESSASLSKSLARLSSGSKLVSPEDDAAGIAVSMRFDAQLARISATKSNIGNAISFSQTQDGFLQKISKALTRMSELTLLAQDATKTTPDCALCDSEFQKLKAYISDVAAKQFNGVPLFGNAGLSVATDSEGAAPTVLTAVDMTHAAYANLLAAGVTTTDAATAAAAQPLVNAPAFARVFARCRRAASWWPASCWPITVKS